MTLSFDRDPACSHLALYLQDGLNALDSRTVVQQVSAYDRLAIATAVDFPFLQVYRGPSSGQQLNLCELKIEYYLLNPAAYFEEPNTLRVVEKAIAELLQVYHHTGENACAVFDLSSLRSSGPLYQRFGENTFPFIRIQVRFTDLES